MSILSQWPLLLGWPSMILALGLCITGAVRRQAAWFVAATVLLVPIAYYLGGSPRTPWGFFVPLITFAGSIGIARRSTRVAWGSTAVLALVIVWLAVIVATGSRPPEVRGSCLQLPSEETGGRPQWFTARLGASVRVTCPQRSRTEKAIPV